MSIVLSPLEFGGAFVDANGKPRSGAKLFVYKAGTQTKATLYVDTAGSANLTNPVVLNGAGQIANVAGTVKPLCWDAGGAYDVVLAPSNDTDPPASPIWTLSGLLGINDTTISVDQWISGPTPTYVSPTSFTLVGDQTSAFHVGRRLKLATSAGTIYATIVGSAYGALTTITVVNDSGALDNGLSSVSYGVLSSTNSSVPGIINHNMIFSGGVILKGTEPSNARLVSSVAGNALTIALKGNDGNDPSATNPVYIPFRDVTSATGDTVWRAVTAATSVVISAGSTLGTVSAVLSRLGVVAFDDGGTVRLGVVNLISATNTYKLSDNVIASSTAEGGAGAAGSANVIYTGAAVASKAMKILGCVESTQATAGTWASAPTLIQLGKDWVLQYNRVSKFQSAQTVIAANTLYTVAHGLGATPESFRVTFINTSTELGYSVGDEINVGGWDNGIDAYTIFANATNIGLVMDASYNVNQQGTPGTRGTLDLTKWKAIFRATLSA